ncbi:NADH:flavin oxidoreductase [Chitinophaga nivalis]|uniref:NADH:flavin oxidoreductase n=1 Tax=Chitinophaga nivalis TaxID=2991709 RepID=A0ABT3IQT8_9BACT|nr:NADH:flavin oxidoreductase [Chitinophaga nivalis]MCW3463976.1 NADH:flavin oxidoreductase [Chitinophaga nivalis]MCW3486334.1 NADH:flavin oxidoreductase [Chitinophaga nivalis]
MEAQHISTHPALAPYHIGQQLIKNRMAVAPMSRASATTAGVPTAAMEAYYEKFATGGFGMIISEGLYTDQIASAAYPQQPGIVTPAQVAAWQQLVHTVKAQDTVFIAQLMHAGALSQHLPNTLAPSVVTPLGRKLRSYGGGDGPFPIPAAMTTIDIQQAIAGYAHAAQQAARAGFDGVEIHAANGYMPDQFLTEYTNLREDAYGGTVANRFRIIAEIMAAVKQVVPADFIVGLRLSEGKVNDYSYRWKGGADTARAILEEVRRVQPSYVHISGEGGSWETTGFYETGESLTGLAKQLVQQPVIANGNLGDAAVVDRVLQEGHADFISLGKAALANPDWPERIRRGVPLTTFDRSMSEPF